MKENSIAGLVTEQNNKETVSIDVCTTRELVRMINREDKKVAEAVGEQEETIAKAIDVCAEKLKKGGRMFYVGAGTSGRLGIVDASECKATYGVSDEIVQAIIPGGLGTMKDASLGDEDDFEAGKREIFSRFVSEHDVVVGIAASGRTPFVLGALEAAGEAKAATVAICNNPNTPMQKLAQITICAVTGPEAIQGSTRMKAGTAQKMVLNMISTGVMVRLGKTYKNLMVDLLVNNSKLKERARNIVVQAACTDEMTAEKALQRCGYQVKEAIVSILKNCGRQEAKHYLEQADGRISKIEK